MHSILPFLLAMVIVIVLIEMLATQIKVAYPVLLVVAGLIVSFIPHLPVVHINPDLIFFIFLPPLLFEAAWSISFKEMKRWYRIIGSFAFLVVFITAFSVAVLTNYIIPGFSIALGFLLGGIVSPPDAVSTGAITKFVKIPRGTRAILEGESLLNDASSLIIFRFALVAIGTGQFIWQQAALSFLWMVIGGAGIGLLLAWFFVKAHKKLPTDAPSDIVFTLVEPYILYWVAEQLHSSGVLAVVVGGLYMSTHRLLFLNSTSRIRGFSVWESFVFVLNGMVFFIIGLDLPEIADGIRADGMELQTAIGYDVIVTGILIGTRIFCSYGAVVTTMIFRPQVMPHSRNRRRRWTLPLLLGWTGMRGVVSLAAALAIPLVLEDGTPFPHRSLIVFITFMVILLTLLIQGLTLPYIIKRSQLFETTNETPEEQARQQLLNGLRQHTYQHLKAKHENGFKDDAGLQKLMQHWESKINTAEDNWMNGQTRDHYLQMLESQRQFLVEQNKDLGVDEELIRLQLYQIDLEEERLRML